MAYNTLLSTSTTPTLTWAAISGATEYQVQIASDQNFSLSVIEYSQDGLLTPTYTPGALTDSQKHFWRFRAKVGGVWQAYQPLRSFFVLTTAAAAYTPTATGWTFLDPDNSADYYKCAVAPNYLVQHSNQRKSQARNIKGDLLTEYVSTRDTITLIFGDAPRNAGGSAYVDYQQLAEMMRFFHMRKTLFLASVVSYGADRLERIWKVDYVQDPQPVPVAPGREDYFEVTLSLQESIFT